MFLCFFFKQKTDYDMRISDSSSDVCSSDLRLDTSGIELGPQAFTVQQGKSKPCDYQRNWQGCGFGSREWTHVDEVVTVATPGAPGHETAMVVWRSQNFREGGMPALQSVIDALVAKYGQPQHVEQSDKRWSNTAGRRELGR